MKENVIYELKTVRDSGDNFIRDPVEQIHRTSCALGQPFKPPKATSVNHEGRLVLVIRVEGNLVKAFEKVSGQEPF